MTYTYDGVTPNETIYGTNYTITPAPTYPVYSVGKLVGYPSPTGFKTKSGYQAARQQAFTDYVSNLKLAGYSEGFNTYKVPTVANNGTYMPSAATLNVLGEPYVVGQGTFKGMDFGNGFMGKAADGATTVGHYLSNIRDRTDDSTFGKLAWMAADKVKNTFGLGKQKLNQSIGEPVKGSWGALSFNEKANTVLGTVNSYMNWRNAKKQLDAYNRGLNHSIAMDNKNYEMARKQWNSTLEERARYKEAMARDQGRESMTVGEYVAKYGA